MYLHLTEHHNHHHISNNHARLKIDLVEAKDSIHCSVAIVKEKEMKFTCINIRWITQIMSHWFRLFDNKCCSSRVSIPFCAAPFFMIVIQVHQVKSLSLSVCLCEYCLPCHKIKLYKFIDTTGNCTHKRFLLLPVFLLSLSFSLF